MQVLLRKEPLSVITKKWILQNDFESLDAQVGSGKGTMARLYYGFETGSRVAVWYPEAGVHATEVVKTIDLLVGSEKRGEYELCVVTQSQVLVERLGALTEQGVLEPGDAEIVLLDGVDDDLVMLYDVYTFDERGILSDGWPVGWFLPDN